MKTRKMMLGAFCAAVMSAAFGCTGLEPYTIDAPDDLADKIAEYQAEKEAKKSDDYEEIDIAVSQVGADDNTADWWAEFSQYFTIPSGKLLTIEFVNHGTGLENWHNWNLVVTNAVERGGDGYAEYFVIRSDKYGWGNGDFDLGLIGLEIDGSADIDWDAFKQKMNGASVKMEIDHSRTGYVFVKETATATDGSVIVETYNQKVSATDDINAFLVVDHSHLKITKATLTPSQVAEIPDENAEAIVVTGFPESVEVGTTFESVFENALNATVTYADKSASEVSIEDVIFTVSPDFGTKVGKETVVYSYSKTKQGNYGPSVAGYATIEITNPIVEIQITKAPSVTTYYFFDNTYLDFRPAGMEVTAVYADDTTGPMPLTALTIAPIELKEGPQDVAVIYKNGDKEISATTPITLVKGAYGVGLPDCTGGFWSAFTEADKPVAAGESVSFEMDVYSTAAENWHAPVAVLRKADLTLGAEGEYAVVRQDNFGWGGGFVNADENKASDWNWDLFKPMLDNAHVVITATNNGDNTATIRFDVTWANGENHFQEYKNIAIDSADAQLGVTIDSCYLVIVK